MENVRLEPLEPIKNFKARMAAFKRRKTNLLKKANEFKILTGAELCMIIYGPKSRDGPSKLETWPSDDGELLNTIKRYKETVGGGGAAAAQRASSSSSGFPKNSVTKVSSSSSGFPKNSITKASSSSSGFPKNSVIKAAGQETAETAGNYSHMKLLGWDPRFDDFSKDQLRLVVDKVTKKLKAANKKLKKMKICENKEVEDSMVVDKVTKKLNTANKKLKKMKICENKEVEDSMKELLQKVRMGFNMEEDPKASSDIPKKLQARMDKAAEKYFSKINALDDELAVTKNTLHLKVSELEDMRLKLQEEVNARESVEARELRLSAALKEIEEEKKQLNDQIQDYQDAITQLQEEYVNKTFLLLP